MAKAILFDLDGTLIPLDTNRFIREYLQAIAAYAAPLMPPAELPGHIMASTMAMIQNTDPGLTNAEAFMADFSPRVGHPPEVLWPFFARFYQEHFPALRERVMVGDAGAGRRAAQVAADLGYEIVLATNPVFPRVAVEERMRWGSLTDLPWRLVTTLEDMHFCRPQPGYYHEVLERIGREPGDCLMVGNDLENDAFAGQLGIRTYIVTDFLVNPQGRPVPEPYGTLADFTRWLAETRP